MKPVLRLLLLTLSAFLGSLFASQEAEAVGWKTAPGEIFCGTLEDAGENGPSAREQCRINGWLNYDTASGCTVAANKTTKALSLNTNVVSNAGGAIRSFTTQSDEVFYRVFSGDNVTGGFLTKTPPSGSSFAREALALPPGNQAEFIQQVVVPAGTRLQRSRALPAFGRSGGAEQFQLLDQIPDSAFKPGRTLQP